MIDMSDESIELPEYWAKYEQELRVWRNTCRQLPRPIVPKVQPSETVMMPMRDGVRLYTEVYLPKGADDGLPSVLIRTPYPDSTFPFSMRPIELFTSGGYAVAVQSCRGTWQSEGEFRFFQNEAADGYDCVEWMAKQSWSNGRIGMYGSSYSGSTQWLAARLRPG